MAAEIQNDRHKQNSKLAAQNRKTNITGLLINPRTPKGGAWVPSPWRFSSVTFLMIPIAKIASAYLLLEMGDTFWHM